MNIHKVKSDATSFKCPCCSNKLDIEPLPMEFAENIVSCVKCYYVCKIEFEEENEVNI